MFFHGSHIDLLQSIEAIGASFAVYEFNDNSEYCLISCNSLYEDFMGRETKKVLGYSLNTIFPRYILGPLQESFDNCRINQKAIETEILIEYKAQERWWRSILSPIIDEESKKIRIIQTGVEITEKKALEKQLNITMKRYEAVVETAYDGIITIDDSQNIKLINEAAKQIFHIKDEDLRGFPLNTLVPSQYRTKHHKYVDGFKHSQIDSRPMQSRASVRGLRRDGTEFPIEVTISKIKVEDKLEMTAVIRDISEKNRLLDELVKAAQEDPLTGLYNRRFMSESIMNELLRTQRYNRSFSIIMADIDYFKKVNDTYGHDCGDNALILISKLLSKSLRDSDIISRLGGEEFLILLPETDLEKSLDIAEKLRSTIESFDLNCGNKIIKLTMSFGVKECLNDEIDISRILKSVDLALYEAKSQGRNRVEYK